MSEISRYTKQELNRLKEENRQLRDEIAALRGYIGALKDLSEVLSNLTPDTELTTLLDRILHSAMLVCNAQAGSLLAIEEGTNDLVFVRSLNPDDSVQDLTGYRVPAGKGIAGWVVRQRKPAIVNNTTTDDRFFAGVDEAFKYVTRSVIAVPIMARGQMLGVIELLNKNSRLPFTEADESLLLLLCQYAGEILHAILADEDGQRETPAASSL